MSWPKDIHDMHTHYGFHHIVDDLKDTVLHELVRFRMGCMEEEMTEMLLADADADADGMVDAIIDLCVFAIGTLDLMGVDAQRAWDRVHSANMSKRLGIKEGRPNPFGFPDLMKPEGWTAPDHSDNVGRLDEVYP